MAKPWKPRLKTIRERNREYLQHNRESCKGGEFQHVAGLVFLEMEYLLKLLDLAHQRLTAAGLPIPGESAVAPPPEPEPEDDDEDEESMEGELRAVTRAEARAAAEAE